MFIQVVDVIPGSKSLNLTFVFIMLECPKPRCIELSKYVRSAITKGSDLANNAIAFATSMLGHLHLVHTARQERSKSQTNTTEASDHAQYGGRGPAAGIAPTVDAGQSDLSAVRARDAHRLPAEVRQEFATAAAVGIVIIIGVVGRRCRWSCRCARAR